MLVLPSRRALVVRDARFASPNHFAKADPASVAFVQTGLASVGLKAGTEVAVAGAVFRYAADTTVAMPALAAGTDYAIYACADGALLADANFSAPAGHSAATSRRIGGFHYAPGSCAPAQNGGDTTPQINPYSLWDLDWRPACPDPRGMTLVAGRFWCDIYPMGIDLDAVGSSRCGVTIADSASPPKVPSLFGGNGTTTYGSFTWFEAAEALASQAKDLVSYSEFMVAAYGAKEGAGRGSDPVTTGYGTTNAGSTNTDEKFTSKWGVVQAAGVINVWGRDFVSWLGGADLTALTTWTWRAYTESRGSMYMQGSEGVGAPLYGGGWSDGASAGSRSVSWNSRPWSQNVNIGARGRADHLRAAR